jgi:hypothetical protein
MRRPKSLVASLRETRVEWQVRLRWGAVGGGGEGGHVGVAPACRPGGGGPARGGGDSLGPTTSWAILHVTPTHTIRALALDTEGIVMPLPTAFGGVEGLVQEKRNGSSEERRGEIRRGKRVRR